MKKNLFLKFDQSANFAQIILASCLIVILIFPKTVFSQSTVIDSLGNAYFFHTSDYPNNQSPYWGDDDGLTNGIAHDNKYWYISVLATNTIGQGNGDWAVRKIPVSRDLMADYQEPICKTVRKSDVPALANYGHAGDLDCCLYNGKYYLVVPFTGDGLPPIVAFFRASDLKFMNYAKLPGQPDVGWCAVPATNNLRLFSSSDDTKTIRHYSISWNIILNHPTNRNALALVEESILKDRNGNPLSKLHNMQGGEFTPDGKWLYINCGIIDCLGGGGPQQYEDGINVINTTNWRLIQHSSNKAHETNPAPGTPIRPTEEGCFDYTFDNTGCSGEEPEGLTIWDMDEVNGHHSQVRGQLHVISYNHNTSPFNENKVILKHYKRFRFPHDVTVYGTNSVNGVPKTHPSIANLLDQGTSFAGCAGILYHNPPAIFPPGRTAVVITLTDYTNVRVQDTAWVTVINKHDECATALKLYNSDSVVTDNFCATPSKGIPGFSCYATVVKDVWFKIIPASSSISIETFQVTNGLTDLVMQAFRGSCGNLQEIACDDNSGQDDHARIIIPGLTGSEPIYIRVTDQGGNAYRNFGICYKELATHRMETDLFTIYPNPTSGIMQVLAVNVGEYEIKVLGTLGELVLPKRPFNSTTPLDISTLANGIYFVDIYDITNAKRVVKKVVKVN